MLHGSLIQGQGLCESAQSDPESVTRPARIKQGKREKGLGRIPHDLTDIHLSQYRGGFSRLADVPKRACQLDKGPGAPGVVEPEVQCLSIQRNGS